MPKRPHRDPSPAPTPVDTSLSARNTEILGKGFWLMSEEFQLEPKDEIAILGLSNRMTLSNLRRTRKVPQGYDAYRRIGLLLGIKKNLEVLFPANPEVRRNWLHVPRDVFKGLSALEFIRQSPLESQARLFTVRRLLDMLRNGAIPELT